MTHSSLQNLKNIINYIFINWNLTKRQINDKYIDSKYNNYNINNTINSIEDFNNNITNFINNDIVICIFVINNIIKYISINL